MALKGLDIFKLTPKTNCKECGSPTCMAFAMKVAQGAVELSKCPHMSEEALATLSEATAPPMKTIKVGTGEAEYTLGGETVLCRHEKTFVSKPRYAVSICSADEDIDAKLEAAKKVDYDRIGERMHVEMLYLSYCADKGVDAYVELVKNYPATEGFRHPVPDQPRYVLNYVLMYQMDLQKELQSFRLLSLNM